MRAYVIKPQARLDLLEIWNYIAPESIAAANKVGEEIDAAILDLTLLPGKGHTRSDAKDERLRFWNVYSYVIAYRYDEKTVMIVRIVHHRRNFRKLFRKRS